MSGKKDEAKWKCVQAMLSESDAEMSDRWIAQLSKKIGLPVSPTFVGKVRRAMESEGRLQAATTRTGQDQRVRKMRRTKEEMAEVRRQKLEDHRRRLLAELRHWERQIEKPGWTYGMTLAEFRKFARAEFQRIKNELAAMNLPRG